MFSHVSALARKVMVPAALALGALVGAPSIGSASAHVAQSGAIAVTADPGVVLVDWRHHRYYGPRYYAPPPPPPWYYRRHAYGPRYYAPPPWRYGYYGPRYYYR